METDVDAVLEREPRNIEALVRKGELRASEGDDRAAAAFYKAALNAAAANQPLPSSLRPVIERAQAGLAACETRFKIHLDATLAQAGFPAGRRPPRFQESLELMLGLRTTSLQLQRPTSYYLPRLPQRRYYERLELPWSAKIEATVPEIKAELLACLAAGEDRFSPYGDRSDPPAQRVSRADRQSGLEHAVPLREGPSVGRRCSDVSRYTDCGRAARPCSNYGAGSFHPVFTASSRRAYSSSPWRHECAADLSSAIDRSAGLRLQSGR